MHPTTTGEAHFHDESDGTLVAVLPAEIDLANAAELRAELDARLTGRPPAMVLDLSGTRFCDSTGVEVLFRTYSRSVAMDVPLHVVLPPGGPARTVCALTGLSRLVPCFADLTAAREALR